MPQNQDLTTLICLFHSRPHAQAALEDLLKAGVAEPNITVIDNAGSPISANDSSLAELNVPARDRAHLLEGIEAGGAVLTVSAISELAAKVDEIFKNHSASKIDEDVVADDMSGVDTLAPRETGATELPATELEPVSEPEPVATPYVYTVRSPR